jgi:hypothetical protein
MDSYKEIKKLDLSETYKTEILGLGEIYEIMSIEHLRKKLSKTFSAGELYLVSNHSHSKRGLTGKELISQLKEQNIAVWEKGFVDSPPWSSNPLSINEKKSYHPVTIFWAKIIFSILIPLEFFWSGPRKSHMLYCFSKK